MNLVDDNPMIRLMARSLDLASRRQGLVASNLANLDTPGYRAQDLDFETSLQAALGGQETPTALRRTHPGHLAGPSGDGTPPPPTSRGGTPSADGNDVDLDRQSLLLAQSQQTYQVASSFLQVELRKLYGLLREAGAH